MTDHLVLRGWRDADRAPFAAMCADSHFLEYLPKTLSREECDAKIDGHISDQTACGFCFWALEARKTGAFAGYTGIRGINFDAHFTPAVEFGWGLPRALWGNGLASEAAKACLEYGFNVLGLPEIVAIASQSNRRSRAVMERIGMSRDPDDDFIHPLMDPDHPLQPCVLYRISASDYRCHAAQPGHGAYEPAPERY
jgi:ribosomal-protein-alanine N-acetyltransferase